MFSIKSYFSLKYVLFLSAVILAYAVMPRGIRRWILLLSSYAFFYLISRNLVIYLLLTTLAVYGFGIWLQSVQDEGREKLKEIEKEKKKEITAQYKKKQKRILALAVLVHVGVLAVLKYSPFTITNINVLMQWTEMGVQLKVPSFAVPVGISFYTLQAVSYLSDISNRKIKADRNLMRVAMFMSFFPEMMEGPICRYENTAESLWNAERMQYDRFLSGMQRILFGFMKKMVVADRLNMMIENVFGSYMEYDGFVIALAGILYTYQLYMDFSGAMDVVIGSAEIFGVRLPENFQRPFFSDSISEFWKRWHISLGGWFKDYIFYPVTMSSPVKKVMAFCKKKKLSRRSGPLAAMAIALFCVWLCNGIWHGAGWNYILFGMYHFVLILMENILEPAGEKMTQILHINKKSRVHRTFRVIRTALLVCLGELFFRADGMIAGLCMAKRIFTDFTFQTLRDGSLFTFGVDRADCAILLVTAVLVFVISLMQEKGIHIRQAINTRPLWQRYAVYLALIMFIVIFGAYGKGYVPLDPIYAGF